MKSKIFESFLLCVYLSTTAPFKGERENEGKDTRKKQLHRWRDPTWCLSFDLFYFCLEETPPFPHLWQPESRQWKTFLFFFFLLFLLFPLSSSPLPPLCDLDFPSLWQEKGFLQFQKHGSEGEGREREKEICKRARKRIVPIVYTRCLPSH